MYSGSEYIKQMNNAVTLKEPVSKEHFPFLQEQKTTI